MIPTGIHHITAISGPARRNLEFYRDVLRMRFVKRTVNFDDPGTYHLYYGNSSARPGSILTFFPWANAAPGRVGTGELTHTTLQIPTGSMDRWKSRLDEHHVETTEVEHFGERRVEFFDPDGMALGLIETETESDEADEDEVPSPTGLHGAALTVEKSDRTAHVLTEFLGFSAGSVEENRQRFIAEGRSIGSVVEIVETPGAPRGRMGAGSVHHIAFRVPNDEAQLEVRERLLSAGHHVTEVKDRNYFHSIYFREPEGVLFEIATDPPGFTVDEPLESLGSRLQLPPWFESARDTIERSLPSLEREDERNDDNPVR